MTNDEFACLAKTLAAELAKKSKDDLVIMLANAIVKSMIAEEAVARFIASMAEESSAARDAEIERREELAQQAMRALEFNWSTIDRLHSEIRGAPKALAKRGGAGRAMKIEVVRQFAIQRFDSGTWRSVRQARDRLFSEVRMESIRVGAPLTTTTGPETVYRWLREHKKSP